MKKSLAKTHNASSFIVTAVLPFCLFACTLSLEDVRIRSGPEASRLLAYISQRNNLDSFKGIGQLRIIGKGKAQTVRVAWMGSQPDNLRLQALGIWGQPTLALLLKGADFCVHTYKNNRYYKGKGTVRNMSRLISVPVKAESLFSLLSGQPPLLAFRAAKMEALEGYGQRCLCLYNGWNRLIEKVWFRDDETTVERVELFDGKGNLRYTVKFSQFQQVDGLGVPHKIELIHTKGVLLLKIDKFWKNIPVPPGTYTLECSDGPEP